MLNQIIHGDCLEEMRHIPDKSIDMILCDLPYGTTACKWDVIIPFDKLWEQYKRIVKPNAAIVLTASQPFTSQLVMSNLEWFKYEWIWNKNMVAGFVQAKNKPMPKHENILVFSDGVTYHEEKTENRMRYFPQGLIEINKSVVCKITDRPSALKLSKASKSEYIQTHSNYPNTVLNFDCERKFHPTQKPVALFEYLIKTYTNEGDLVLDNCAGSGTTAVAAINTNRNYICIEKEKEYFDIACDRINQPREYSELEIEIKELNKPEFKQLSLLDLI
jgi:site-specific DNA-methyltransferase (adenine-specific)